jgi:hypothetical protein
MRATGNCNSSHNSVHENGEFLERKSVMSSDLFQQGVEAFHGGDKVRAKEIMLQVTAAEPDNESAWFVLAAAETDDVMRRQHLERVLQINPNHARAREVLAKLNARAGGTASAAAPAAAPPPKASRVTPLRPLNPSAGDTIGGDLTGGFVLPVSIPGAPSQVSPRSLFKGGWELFQKGLDVLQRKAGVLEDEVARATWWRFWLLVGFGYTFTTIFYVISNILTQARLTSVGFRFSLGAVLVALILTIPIGLMSIYAGVYASHWWAKRQGGELSLLQHAYAVALPYVPAWAIGSAIGVLFASIGFGGELVALIVSIYGLYIMALGFERLYGFSDPNQKWFTVGAMYGGFLVALFVISAVLGAIFGVGRL